MLENTTQTDSYTIAATALSQRNHSVFVTTNYEKRKNITKYDSCYEKGSTRFLHVESTLYSSSHAGDRSIYLSTVKNAGCMVKKMGVFIPLFL